jgi:hypothetical protein
VGEDRGEGEYSPSSSSSHQGRRIIGSGGKGNLSRMAELIITSHCERSEAIFVIGF